MKRMPASRTPRAFQYQAVGAEVSPQAISSDLTRSTAWCLCFCAKSYDRPREAEKGTAQPSITDVGIKPSRHVDLSSSRPSDRDACQSGIPYRKESPRREQSTKGTQPLKPVGDGRPNVVSRRTMTKKLKSFHIQIHIPCREADLVFMTYMREMKQKKGTEEPTRRCSMQEKQQKQKTNAGAG